MGRMPTEEIKDNFRKRALDFMIVEQLVKDVLKANDINITDDLVKQEEEKIAQQRGMTVDKFEEMIKKQMSISEFRQQVKLSLGFAELMTREMAGKAEDITEADAKKFYDENIKRFESPEKVRASHILIGTREFDKLEADAKAKARAEAKATAEDVLKQVKAGGDFAELAGAYSTCPSKAKGGDLDFGERRTWVPAFSEAAFALKIGEISDVVETPFGYHIITVTDRQEAGVKSFESEKATIIDQLQQRKKGTFTGKFIEDLKTKAEIIWPEEPRKEGKPPDKTEDK